MLGSYMASAQWNREKEKKGIDKSNTILQSVYRTNVF